jgi:hypothetical protein
LRDETLDERARGGPVRSRVSRDTIYAACGRREIHHSRINGRRAIRFRPEWIDAWLERYRVEPKTTTMPVARH